MAWDRIPFTLCFALPAFVSYISCFLYAIAIYLFFYLIIYFCFYVGYIAILLMFSMFTNTDFINKCCLLSMGYGIQLHNYIVYLNTLNVI